jgi:hypothetical protein
MVSTPVVKFTFSSMVKPLTKALALAAAMPQPPSPEIGSVDTLVVEQIVKELRELTGAS